MNFGATVADFGADCVVLTRGDVGKIAAKLDAWRDAGGTHFSVVTMGLGLDSLDAHIDYIASVSRVLSLS